MKCVAVTWNVGAIVTPATIAIIIIAGVAGVADDVRTTCGYIIIIVITVISAFIVDTNITDVTR